MGLRGLWESEESRRRRVEPGQEYQGMRPDWVGQYGDIGRQITSLGAEEARQEGRRASDILSEDRRQQGAIMGQGLRDIGDRALSAYKTGRELGMAEEARQEQREAANLARERAQLEQQYLPGQLEQQRELGQAQLEQTRGATQQQQIALEAARRQQEFLNSDAQAAGLPEARPGETVAMYEQRMDAAGKSDQRRLVTSQLEAAAFDLTQRKDLAPIEKQRLLAEIEASRNALQANALQSKIAKLDIYERQRGINVRGLTSQLSMYADNPQALQAKANEMLRDGIPADTVGESIQQVRNNLATRQQQELLTAQLDPQYQRMLARQEKADKYAQAIAILQDNERYLGGFGTPGDAQEQQSIVAIQQALSQIGMDELAQKIGQSLTFQGLTPTSRKALVRDTIRRVKDQFQSELSAGGVPASPAARRIYHDIQNLFMSTQMTAGPSQQNLFGNAPNLDFSDGGI